MSLIAIEDKLMSLGGKNLLSFSLPKPQRVNTADTMSREVLRETSYNIPFLHEYVTINEPKLLPDQRDAYNTIVQIITTQKGGIFFLNAPGGTGKTFVTSLLLAKIRTQKNICLAVASSGIPATLLAGGRTAHSTLKLPLNLAQNDTPTCNLSKGSNAAKLLQLVHLIMWDECTMSHKAAFEAVDRTLRVIRGNGKIMGGITFVMSGDFRQTLQIPKGTRADELKACIKSSYIWSSVRQLVLSTNMRPHLLGEPMEREFAAHLLRLDEGTIPVSPFSQCAGSVDNPQECVFPNLVDDYPSHSGCARKPFLHQRTIR
ncbi:PREDICTED: ATP-dependent DNA helicase PIF1-like [Priapulus caudatus]|uniref:ATP-dependent DNA helicase n=1 Tax=Priapulus caudatus TaxID=37621 RepID=A0ABM1E3M5_PRICU|nr:PREDICTED: ATP-dependent DNA helicase PIF1-like [Priapulus caudatus]